MMGHIRTAISDVRPLTDDERALIRWMLDHSGADDASRYLSQSSRTSVISRCPCGCATVNFAIDGSAPPREGGMQILCDFEWRGPDNELMGAFVFARAGLLAG